MKTIADLASLTPREMNQISNGVLRATDELRAAVRVELVACMVAREKAANASHLFTGKYADAVEHFGGPVRSVNGQIGSPHMWIAR